MLALAKLTVPVIALGLGNKVLMLENAIYSILSPEGYASILWKDASRTKEAAEKMKLTAKDLYELGIIDKIIKEPKGDEEDSFLKVAKSLKKEILKAMEERKDMSPQEMQEERYQKFRNMGEYKSL